MVILAGGAMILGAWGSLRGLPGALAWTRSVEDEIAQAATLLERAQRETSDLKALSDSIGNLEKVADDLPRVLLLGEDAQTAAFDLTRRLTVSLGRSSAFVESISPLPDTVALEHLDRVSVKATMETDFVGLADILRRVEGDSVMAVAGLRVTATNPDARAREVERLAVVLAVTGWYRPGAPPPDSAAGRKEAP